uniref:BCAR3 adaptor protein, NSP family member n=1 Tax=Astyanax mexicanus TaxID=7994 RepID=A0A8B9HXD8_ASTMX
QFLDVLWQEHPCGVPGVSMALKALKDSLVPVYVQFSREKYIMDGAPEKLRRELEEELKQCGEEPRSHAWYHGAIPRQVHSHRMHLYTGVTKDKCGSQPACLNHVQERRGALKTHQSESFLPLGSRPQAPAHHMETRSCSKSPVFRTGSEPALSPTVPRRMAFETQPGEAIRGSDSQLCPKPPPKPSKVPSSRIPRSPRLQPLAPQAPQALEDETVEKEQLKGYRRPVFETVSAFKPAETDFRLLPSENKPLEMSVLKKAKELLVSQDPKTIAKHMLRADCEVARTLNVSEEMKAQMGVTSGLELVTLPHGRQLRQDLLERHNTMAIGVAVDILGCTGSLEERAATLNRIILVALELKDSMGDLYAFSSIMKALDMPQITRLDHTWTTLRRKYTQTAIIYEKSLKPFYKGLYEGSAEVPLSSATVPLLMPLLTLMERPAVAFEGMELWESSDQGCEIMLRHLEEARAVARNADTYSYNAQRVLHSNYIKKNEMAKALLWYC